MRHESATLIILAGGESKRMGFPKHKLTVEGRDVISHLHDRLGGLFAETIVVGRDALPVPAGVRVVEDRFIMRSPLVGIHAGLSASQTDLCVVIACDMPHVEPKLVEHLLTRAADVDVVVPIVRGYFEPLCAAYRRSCVRPVERMIRHGNLKVSSLYGRVKLREICEIEITASDPDLRSFANLNVLESVAVYRGATLFSAVD